MRAILEPIPAAERLEKLHAYEAFLIERDGLADFDAGTLARREIAIARMEASPLRYRGPFDVALFAKQYRRFDPRLATPAEMLLLLVFVKTNANEAYGVEQAEKRPPSGDPLRDRLEQLVLLEERYHTRLLLGASAFFGVATASRSRRPRPPAASSTASPSSPKPRRDPSCWRARSSASSRFCASSKP